MNFDRQLLPLFSVLTILIFASSCHHSRKFNEVTSSNSIDIHREIIKKYPKSKHVGETQVRLDSLVEASDWIWARRSNTISSYKVYLNKYPIGKYANEAAQFIDNIEIERDWTNAKFYNTISSFSAYLEKHPNSIHSPHAKTRIEDLKELRSWNAAKGINTISALNEYLKFYPNGKFIYDAKTRIYDLEVLQPAWKKALIEDTRAGYEHIIEQYPYSKYVDQAKDKLQGIEDQIWRVAVNEKTIGAIDDYLDQYPEGRYIALARNLKHDVKYVLPDWNRAKSKNTPFSYRQFMIKHGSSQYTEHAQNAIDSLEEEYWERALKTGKLAVYRRYIKNFPNGRYIEKAEKTIIDLEVDAIIKGKHGKLPPMSKTSYGLKYSTVNEIEIVNDTRYTLTVRYSGEDSKKIVVPPHGKQSFSLNNGAYRVAASVSASHVQNYAGNETLEGGSYSSRFYIKTYKY